MSHPSYIDTSVCTCDKPEFVKDTFIGIEFCNKCAKDKKNLVVQIILLIFVPWQN
jgi:hypothetical protein